MQWHQIESALDGMMSRRWYTNHGPKARELEARCTDRYGVPHAVAVTNPCIGLMMLAETHNLSGDVLLSALAPPRCAQALAWVGLRPRFCDVRPDTLGLDLDKAGAAHEVAALLETSGVSIATVAAFALENEWAFLQDDGVAGPGPALIDLPGFGDDAGAACIVTDDDELAARLRNTRSSYGAGPVMAVKRTANGRLSEIQAAIALLTLDARDDAGHDRLGRIVANRRYIPFGREVLVVADSADDVMWLSDEIANAGYLSRRFTLDRDAGACEVAARFAARALVLPVSMACLRAREQGPR